MAEKIHQIALYFVNRFVLGWYGVEQRLFKIEAILTEIKAYQEHACDDCPTRPWQGEERRHAAIPPEI